MHPSSVSSASYSLRPPLLPLLVLFYIFITNSGREQITISASDLGFTMFFATLGILAAFIGMRSALKKIQTLHSISDPQEKAKTGKEQNEIDALLRSFSSIQKQVEENIRKLEEIKKS